MIASDLLVFRKVTQGVPELIVPRETAGWEAAIAEYVRPDSLAARRS